MNNDMNSEDEAPFAFGAWDIPMLDEELLDNHLLNNQNEEGEGGEELGSMLSSSL